MLTLLDDYFLNQVLDTDMLATTLWNHIKNLYHVSDLASKTTGLTSLISFDYSAPTMLDNKVALLVLLRHLKSAFGGATKIDLNELALLFALVNLPAAYGSLRTQLLTASTSTNPLTIETLFQHLSSEEQTQNVSATSLANRAATITPSSHVTSAKCPHSRRKDKCYTCTPLSRPLCSHCKSAGLPDNDCRHKPGSKFCKQTPKGTSLFLLHVLSLLLPP
jgi:hypothetical protein